MLPNLVVITFLENYVYFVNTLDTIGNQWEIFVYRLNLPETSFYQNEGAEWRILVPGCVDFLGRMWTARLSSCLCVRLGGSRAADPPFAWERGKGEPSDPPSDPPQRRPTPATHPRSYRHVAGVR